MSMPIKLELLDININTDRNIKDLWVVTIEYQLDGYDKTIEGHGLQPTDAMEHAWLHWNWLLKESYNKNVAERKI